MKMLSRSSGFRHEHSHAIGPGPRSQTKMTFILATMHPRAEWWHKIQLRGKKNHLYASNILHISSSEPGNMASGLAGSPKLNVISARRQLAFDESPRQGVGR